MKLGYKVGFVILSTVLVGCASKPDPIAPQPYDASQSFAYNIANQTYLTKDNSPLKDFSSQEIEESRVKLEKESGGSASVFFGTLALLTGNFTGVIDIAGGSAAKLANSKHAAATGRWIVLVEPKQFNNALEAEKYILKEINNTYLKVLSQYGKTAVADYKGRFNYIQFFSDDGKELNVGGFYEKDLLNKTSRISEIHVEIPSFKIGDYYTSGFQPKDNLFYQGLIISGISAQGIKVNGKPVGYDKIWKEITLNLPKGFFYYSPATPYSVDGTPIVPAIYTQGKKYEFIKPEIKPTTSKTAKAEQGGQGE